MICPLPRAGDMDHFLSTSNLPMSRVFHLPFSILYLKAPFTSERLTMLQIFSKDNNLHLPSRIKVANKTLDVFVCFAVTFITGEAILLHRLFVHQFCNSCKSFYFMTTRTHKIDNSFTFYINNRFKS